MPFPPEIVKKITGFPWKVVAKGCTFFVKKIAIPENARKTASFCPGGRMIQVAGNPGHGRPERSFRTGSRLARMLLPQCNAMIADLDSTMISGRYMTAALQRPVVKPRGLSTSPSFFCLISLRDSFHKSVGTHSRPLRGGKEESVCRVM
jgi:hypothetical protein